MKTHFHRLAFVTGAVACATPWMNAPSALVLGIGFALTLGNPFPVQSKSFQTVLLQVAVVGLGAAMNLNEVIHAGVAGFAQTFLSISATLIAAMWLARAMKTDGTTSLLIGVGTAICGGSAIAAAAPAIGAKPHQTSVALAVIFVLNSVALLLFPMVGHWVQLPPESFGWWSAIAIHDTSSVVGAAMSFDASAVPIATTVKLARALWIVPVTWVLAKHSHSALRHSAPQKKPWFILGFLAMAALFSWTVELRAWSPIIVGGSRRLLVLTLFLVGSGLSREAMRQVGFKPVFLGVMLWLAVASISLLIVVDVL